MHTVVLNIVIINQTFNSYYLEMVAIIYEFNWKQYVSATTYKKLEEENKKLKNSIEYRKKKADKNQEKANEIDKILRIPWILKEDGKIDRPKVAFSYII